MSAEQITCKMLELIDTSPTGIPGFSDEVLKALHDRLHAQWDSKQLEDKTRQSVAKSHLLTHQELYRRGSVSDVQGGIDDAPVPILMNANAWKIDPESMEVGEGQQELVWKNLPVVKAKGEDEDKDEDSDERIILGVVAEPEVIDAHGHVISVEEIAQAAHVWLAKKQNRGEMHTKFVNNKVEIYESYITPVALTIGGQKVKKNSWLLMLHILDNKIWKKIKSGEFTGLSLGGFARVKKL